MAASNNEGGNGTAPPIPTNRVGTPRPPLPLSIAVRNLFPPLALPDDSVANDVVAAPLDAVSAGEEGEGEGEEEEHAHHQQQQHNSDGTVGMTTSKKERHQRRIKLFASKISSSLAVEDRCALVSREVLLRLRLDIIVIVSSKTTAPSSSTSASTCDNENESDNDKHVNVPKEEDERVVIYSHEQSHCTAHPRWDHINEQIATTLDNHPNHAFARFVVLNDNNANNNPCESSSNNDNEWILAEIPFHPSKLRRLPMTAENNIDTDNNNNNNNSNSSVIIPHSLPPNTILLHYDDGYTRVLPNVYRLLVQKGIITENHLIMDPIKRNGSGDDEYRNNSRRNVKKGEEEERGKKKGLFEEKAFDVLGGSVPVIAEGVALDTTPSTYHDDDKVFDLLGKPTKGSIDAQQRVQNNQSSSAVKSEEPVFDDRALDLVGGGYTTTTDNDDPNKKEPELIQDSKEAEPELIPKKDIESDASKISDDIDSMTKSHSAPTPSPPVLPLPSLPANNNDSAGTTKDEIQELHRLIRMEQQLLEEEQQRIFQGTNHLKYIMQQVQQLENETFEIMKAVGAERANLFRSEFRLEAHRIHLLQHLQLIFPIKITPINISSVHPPNYPQHQYTIASLPLPDDIHNPTVTDDQVSTALGFLCHLTSLTSKYLAIPMRYTVVCKFSRSAILFDQGRRDNRGGTNNGNNEGSTKSSKVVYPLFRDRGVIDREQLDYGLMLLERNIDCLLRVRNVGFRPEWNVLAKMDKLLMQVIEGEEPSFGGYAG